ncbi:heparan-alpha-glucosaminide N-acetyltransferase-like, partial [Amphibalanus amphitrite]|uniref:heparan-alpha-glucosaminide N-acetyltransferase-like n=1 Tax=Amphibalanus amphitrite TaxID=1232801 RepID=UPI001C90D6BA
SLSLSLSLSFPPAHPALPHPHSTEYCSLEAQLGDQGFYELSVNSSGCHLTTVQEPRDVYKPLWVFALVLLGLAIIHGLWSCIATRVRNRRVKDAPDLPTVDDAQKQKQKSRLASLDVFRGVTILVMIFVNQWQGQYWFFEHSTWNGLQVADLVFAWFMWIMGACIPLSLSSQIRRGKSMKKMVFHIFKRSWWLLIIGISLNSLGGYNKLETYRLPGVLQRFAITYLVMALAMLPAMARKPKLPEEKSWTTHVYDITCMWPQWILAIAIIIGHTCIIFLLHVPNCPTGYLGPGGLYNNSTVDGSCVGGATGYIDRLVFGKSHIYQNPTPKATYGTAAFDPEGLLGVMLACISVFLGVQAGMTLYIYKDWRSRVIRWTAWGVVTGVIATGLCGGSQDGGVIPVNKNLWSLSYVMVTSCFAFFLLTAFYIVVDILKWWTGSPFFYPGRNALLMYVGHEVTFEMFPFTWQYGDMQSHFWRLGEALWTVMFWLVVSVWMHEKKYFWKL